MMIYKRTSICILIRLYVLLDVADDIQKEPQSIYSLDDYVYVLDVATRWNIINRISPHTVFFQKHADVVLMLSIVRERSRWRVVSATTQIRYWIVCDVAFFLRFFAVLKVGRTGPAANGKSRTGTLTGDRVCYNSLSPRPYTLNTN